MTKLQHSLDPLEVAETLARDAGELIAKALGAAERIDRKSPINLVTEIDEEAERMIVAGLRRAFPEHEIVAEESAPERPGEGPCWFIDPIDGTTNFVHGLPHCAVSIGFADDGAMQAAVVHDPCKDETFTARRGSGAHLNGRPIHVSDCESIGDSLVVTGFPYDRREHLSFYLAYFEKFLNTCRDLRRYGSASLDLCYVAAGRFDGFWEWKLAPWDTAAGWLVVEEAGGRVSDFDGSQYDPWLPRVLATNGRFHEQMLDVLRTLPPSP
jgi:myo-inositol-1(or 4)-monophosphatase